jgi:hypothetical protein
VKILLFILFCFIFLDAKCIKKNNFKICSTNKTNVVFNAIVKKRKSILEITKNGKYYTVFFVRKANKYYSEHYVVFYKTFKNLAKISLFFKQSNKVYKDFLEKSLFFYKKSQKV